MSSHFIRIYDRKYQRRFLTELGKNRFSIVVGQRGVGKTTVMIQHLRHAFDGHSATPPVLYIQADHFLVGQSSLYEIAEEFHNFGGRLICFDEIHKYPNWSGELKSIYDTFPKLNILASGSSALEIHKGSHDLSRRAIVRHLPGLSFREFIELFRDMALPSFSLLEIITNHERIAPDIIHDIEQQGAKVLALFRDYLAFGYYPYFQEFKDKELFYITLEQNIHTSIENDLLAVHPGLSGASIKKIKKLLAVISLSVPFTPDLKKMKTILEIGDERTLKTYLTFLEDAGLILTLPKTASRLRQLEKPEKIYLNNPNQILAICSRGQENRGNIRETFFMNLVSVHHNLTAPERGDFLIDNEFTVEVGGKGKDFTQIRDVRRSYLAMDDIETGFKNRIPLWLFGFLH
ncbi:MAG: AAA family ATPase [Desulfobacterales bacterium]|nr:AAA family ATPase [Desulfobacterales bacterium]